MNTLIIVVVKIKKIHRAFLKTITGDILQTANPKK
jgi:hypothetical protein